MINLHSINVYEISDNCKITLINPDNGFSSEAEAEQYAYAISNCDSNGNNRYLVIEGGLLAAFAGRGNLGVQEPDDDDLSLEPDAA
jgi:hypothetical protein